MDLVVMLEKRIKTQPSCICEKVKNMGSNNGCRGRALRIAIEITVMIFLLTSEVSALPDGGGSGGGGGGTTNNICASMCHNYEKRLPRNVDYYPNSITSFDRYVIFLGFLNQMRGTPMNVTDPAIDFYYNPAELNGSGYDYFRKVQPSYQQSGHAFFKFENMTLSNGNGTFGIDEGERVAATGFDVLREVENNGLITDDGYLNVTVSAVLYENVNNYIALSAGLWNTSEFNVWVVNWTSSEPVNYSDIRSDNVFVHFRTEGKNLPRSYELNVTFYVDKIIPANITLKPRVSVDTQNNLQHIESLHGSNVNIKGTKFTMNATFRSSNDNLTWIAEEAFEKRVELEGGLIDIQSPYAEFFFTKNFVIPTDYDSLSSGSYLRNWWYRLQIDNREDAGHAVLGNLNFSARADNITYVGERRYAAWNKTSAKWAFPPEYVIRENEGFGVGFDTNYTATKTLNVDVGRWMNKTEFYSDGYQLANFSVTFKDKNFRWVWGRIEAFDFYPGYGIDASIVPGTFNTNAPGNFREDENVVHFDIDKERLQTGVTYNFSVVIRVNLTGERRTPIHFKPEMAIGEELYHDQAYGTGYTVEVPPSMLPEHIDHISASTNTSNTWLINRFDHVIALLRDDISPPVITDFNVLPNTSVSLNNPAIASATISDENLKTVAFVLIDFNNLVSTNRTILGVYFNESGVNGKYVSPQWYGNAWSITNGTVGDIITAMDHENWQDYVFVQGLFKKNATVGEENAVLWFNRTTGLLSNVTIKDAGPTPLIIENGISTFKVLISKIIEDNEPPSEVSGTTYKLFYPGNINNPYIFLSQVPSGIYTGLVRAEDIMGNGNGAIVDVGVSNTIIKEIEPPQVSITSPASGSTLTVLDNVVAVNVSDASPPIAVKLYLNGTLVKDYSTGSTSANFTTEVDYIAGTLNMLNASATDKWGNVGWSNISVKVVDNTNTSIIELNESETQEIILENQTAIEITADANATIRGNITVTADANISRLNASVGLANSTFGLQANEVALDMYVEVNATNINISNVSSVNLTMFYTDNGIAGLDENTLKIYWWNGSVWNPLDPKGKSYATENGPTVQDIRRNITANKLTVQLDHFSTFALVGALIPTATPAPPPSGGGGSGGGGGGGGASGENFSNVIVREKYDEAIFKDKVTSYKFKNASNPITHVNVTGKVNAGLITAMIEVLKGTSTLVKEAPPGIVNKNVNLWLGTSGFAVPKNLKEVVIRFRVENSWMQGHNVDARDIKLLRWDSTSKKWMTLKTEVKEKDGTNTYFEATTNSLSPLAISAVVTPPGGPVAGAPPAATPPGQGEIPSDTAPKPKGTPGFEGVITIAALSALYIWRKRR